MTRWWIGLIALSAATGCSPGDFCDLYLPVHGERSAVAALVAADRAMAEAIAVNNASYDRCAFK